MFEPPLSAGSTSSTSGLVTRRRLLVFAGLPALVCAWPCLASEDYLRRIAALEFPVERQVSFVALQMNRLLRQPAEQRGVVWIAADGALIMRVEEPVIEERRLHQGELSLRRLPRRNVADVNAALARARRRTMKLDPGRSAHVPIAALADVLRGDVAALRRRFSLVDVSTDGKHADDWVIELVPTDAKLRKALGRVLLRGRGVHLAVLEVGHGRKKWRKMRFQDIAKDAPRALTP